MPDPYKIDVDDSLMRFKLNTPRFVNNISHEIPAFAEFEHENITSDIMRRRIFSWITIMYDPNTPLRREIKDLYKRKIYAGTLTGLTIDGRTGKYAQWIEDIFTGKDPGINRLIAKYVASFSSPEYMQLMGHVAMQEKALQKIIAGKADKNVQVMFDTSTEKVKELTNFIYGSGERDEVAEARRALYKQVAYDLSDMRPEQVARSVSDGDGLPDEWNPYEAGYVPGDIHFKGDDPNIAEDDEELLP